MEFKFACTEELKDRIEAYFRTSLYQTGLRDPSGKWLEKYLNEETGDLDRTLRFERMMGCRMKDYPVHLIVGAGTGGLIAVLRYLEVQEIYAIEPCEQALAIAKEKARLSSVKPENVTCDVAESMPFPDGSMDMVHCNAVLEHVQDVRQSIHEMYRVLKPGGMIQLVVPDYRGLFEGHYKTALPLFLGKRICKFLLKLKGRPAGYLDSINFVTERKLDEILQKEADCYFRVYEKLPEGLHFFKQANSWRKKILRRIIAYYYSKFSIPLLQVIFVKKLR